MDKQAIVKRLKEDGLVGAGGAGFPTYVKLQSEVDTVIANAAECEPLLYSDKALMKKYTVEFLQGLSIACELTGASRGIIAVKGKYPDIIEMIKENMFPHQEIFELPDSYPVGDEQVLVWEVLNRIVPEGGIPLQVGVVVQNVGTLLNIFNSVEENKPVTSRFITVTGEVVHPFVGEVVIGTPIKELLDYAGGVNPEYKSNYVILEGGPMTGSIVEDSSKPVSKTTSGIIVLPPHHFIVHQLLARESLIVKKAQAFCCMCRSCTEVCPRYLIGHNLRPDQIMKSVSIFGTLDTTAYLCCECGLCEVYACPLDLSPRLIARQLKQRLMEAGIKNPHTNTPAEVHMVREFRQIPGPRLIMKAGLKKYSSIKPAIIDKVIVPNLIQVLLQQHIGKPNHPVVKPGEMVKAGQAIGELEPDELGAYIHSGISGEVTGITDDYIEIKNK